MYIDFKNWTAKVQLSFEKSKKEEKDLKVRWLDKTMVKFYAVLYEGFNPTYVVSVDAQMFTFEPVVLIKGENGNLSSKDIRRSVTTISFTKESLNKNVTLKVLYV